MLMNTEGRGSRFWLGADGARHLFIGCNTGTHLLAAAWGDEITRRRRSVTRKLLGVVRANPASTR